MGSPRVASKAVQSHHSYTEEELPRVGIKPIISKKAADETSAEACGPPATQENTNYQAISKDSNQKRKDFTAIPLDPSMKACLAPVLFYQPKTWDACLLYPK
ncbi:hypothetical protein DSO57_1000868 [Entomophthora muscae]|uniref:Uncharacterized protein n=1 Tax=Entomophthora muscae TaxID=34485 RepID=A0ACC2SY19_9FUNG|nr:hypothetical protein DSO57_1000868 [Entomophthora muscae]